MSKIGDEFLLSKLRDIEEDILAKVPADFNFSRFYTPYGEPYVQIEESDCLHPPLNLDDLVGKIWCLQEYRKLASYNGIRYLRVINAEGGWIADNFLVGRVTIFLDKNEVVRLVESEGQIKSEDQIETGKIAFNHRKVRDFENG